MTGASLPQLAVVPILIGPLQVFLALLPAILFGIGSALLALFKPATFKLALRLLWRVKLSLLLAITILTGTVFAARAVWRNAGTIGHVESGAHDWPLFRGNARRTAAADSGGAPLEGGLNWAFAGEAKTFHSSPTVVGNRVYATSAEVGVFSNRGAIYCLDADTGGVVWKSVPDGMRATFSSPSISGKYLVTGEGLHQVRDGRITCLDVTRGGAVLWTFRTKGHVESSAAISDGRAIIGAGDDGYYCLRLEPDAQGNPVLLWHLSGDQFRDAENDPIIHEGRAYLGLGIGGNAVVCVDAVSGQELWRVATTAPVFSPPSIARGKFFIGMGHGNFVESEEKVIAAELERLRAAGQSASGIESAKAHLQPGGEAWCIDLATHQVEWRFKTDSTVLGAIVAGDDRLFFASRGGTVYSLGFDGKPLATWNARAPIIASLAATASHVYAVTQSGLLFALEQSNLQPVWETRLGSAGTFLSSAAIARGHVYVGSPEDGLLCVGRPAGQTTSPIWAGELGGAGVGGNPRGVSLAVRGEIIPETSRNEPDTLGGPAAVLGSRLFLPLAAPGRTGVTCLLTGGEAQSDTEQWFFPTRNSVTSSLGASQMAVVFSDGSHRMAERELHYVDAFSGTQHWSADVETGAYGFACLTPQAVLAEVEIGSLTAFDLQGRACWRQPLGPAEASPRKRALTGPPAVSDSLIVAASAAGLLVLDAHDGAVLWRVPMSDAPASGPIVHHKAILVGTATGIFACRILDGQPLWHARVGPVKSAIVRCGRFAAATTSEYKLIVLDPENGDIYTTATATGDQPPLPAHDALLYARLNEIVRLNLADKSKTSWVTMRSAQVIASPLIVSGSSVYFSAGGGLIRAVGKPDHE